ncbi:MAG: DUF4982 domain-containing protein [Lachnospiraceae bacterium]|nr:DUF4982 domain-containing protein [Lachnospiraceae bacterium]
MKRLFVDNWTFGLYDLNASAEELLSASASHRMEDFAPVDLPHDWLIGNARDLYRDGIGCYRKTFAVDLPEGSRPLQSPRFFLRFEGVYMDSRYYINGREVFAWPYGYSTFEFEITPYLLEGDNELVVTVTYKSPNTRWYSGAGIFRNVYLLTKQDPCLVSDGIYAVATPACEARDADGIFPGESILSVETEVNSACAVHSSAGAKDPTSVLLRQTLRDADGSIVASSENEFSLSGSSTIRTQTLTVPNAHAWDIDSPYLYELTTELFLPCGSRQEYALLDSHTQRIGFRSVRLDPDRGFFLNGRHVKIHGACMHHDLGALGAAVNKVATKRQLLSLLAMGVNAVRTSHNMPSVEFMDLCDELGILVDSEAFDMWELHKTDFDYAGFFRDHWKADVASWIRRDRNRPSVVFWSIGNEIYDTHTERGLIVTRELRDEVRRHDYRHHAYVTIGSNYVAWEGAQRCADLLEASGYNYLERLYEEHHERYPHWCIYGSETSSTVQSRGVYHFPADVRLLTFEDGQCSSLSNCSTNWGAKNPTVVITGDRDKEFSLGQFIWTGWDYIGEPTPYHLKNSFFGQCDTAGFPKDSYYIYQAGWTDASTHPMVHIVPYWDFNEGQTIDVQVFSNCPKVELFLQKDAGNDQTVSGFGISLGTRDIDALRGSSLHGSWRIPYTAGTLTAVAYDANGTVVAKDTQRSFGDPVSIILEPDKTTMTADGEDMIFVEVSTADANGTFVADARNRMNVTVSGAARLVGMDNGDSTDYDEYKGTSRRLFSGRLLVMLAARREAGEITITVSSAGLPDAVLHLIAVASETPVDPAVCASASNLPRITDEDVLREVPVRKIELTLQNNDPELTPDRREMTVTADIFPANATFGELTFRVMTADGIDSVAIRVTPLPDGRSAKITALGDEERCFLYAFANNGKTHADVISSLELHSTGLGRATTDPYEFVNAIRCDASNQKPTLSFDGGAFTADEPTWVRFDNVDFGDYGSDTITIPIFSFSDNVPIEVWEGTPNEEGSTLLFRGNYEAKSRYNHYQPNTFTLAKRLRGVTSVSILVPFRLSLHGFVFDRIDKAWAEIGVTELVSASGDNYRVDSDGVYGITNNVDLGFGMFDFGERGARKITLTGQSHVPQCTIHLHFTKDGITETQIIDIPKTETTDTFTFPLEPMYDICAVNFIFLPGSNFDLVSFRFE